MGSRRGRHAALVVALFGCGSSTAKPPATPPPALGNAAPAPSGGSVQLTWVLAPPSVKHQTYDMLMSPLTLEVTINGATQKVKLEPQLGALYPYNQVVCKTDAYPLEPTEVAKITFYEGGAGGYAVKRKLDDTLVVMFWNLTDGACEGPGGEPVACPRFEKAVTTVSVPSGATVTEAIVEVDKQGLRKPFSCAELP